MPVKINGATSGSVTLAAPATGSDVTLTLPTLGFGKVLQVVYGSSATQTTNNTSTFSDTGLSATITPSASTSKVLVIVQQAGVYKQDGNSLSGVDLKLMRGASDLVQFASQVGFTNTSAFNLVGTQGCVYLDSPATTSATTYKTQFRNATNAAGVVVQTNSAVSTIALIEVAA